MNRVGILSVCFILILCLTAPCTTEAKSSRPSVAVQKFNPQECYECHDQIKDLHSKGTHAKVGCDNCHQGLPNHLKSPDADDARPVTNFSWEACGGCHKDQYNSFMKESYHRPARDEKSLLTGRAPNPFWDKLMMGHGFTKEHNTTRSHKWMLVDHLVVDRAFGGRFQPKDGWYYILESGKVWDILKDTHPESNEQRVFFPQTAAAANPTCMQCKSQDNILERAYMGNTEKGAKWSRTSNVVELARSNQYGLNCFYCHDPHNAGPRIVRDGLIEALTRKEGDTLWHKDPKHTNIKVMDMGVRGFTRKIALLDKYDTKLLCGQCHVEYTCNPGYDTRNPDTSKYSVTYTDLRTNHFPFKDVLKLYDHYVNQVNFLDFKHTLTGGLLWKAQHPEAETYYNSKHAAAGVGCDDCHMPTTKNKSGKKFTSHFALAPRYQVKETCLKCHQKWTEEQALYTIDSVKTHIKGKMRKAEFWISNLIDAITDAQKAGVAPELIKQAQDQHLKAHILWEYWTAENSDGFHNPELAKESLVKSMDEAQKGISLLKQTSEKH